MVLMLLVAALSVAALAYTVFLVTNAARNSGLIPKVEGLIVGGIANFFDTLGIGSFATTMAWFHFRKLVPHRLIPLTLMTGYAIPTFMQGIIFLSLLGVGIDPWLILACTVAMVIGGYLGVPIAARAPIAVVRIVVAFALLTAAFFFSLSNLGLMPIGGTATGLALGPALFVVALHVVFGILLSFGVGNYAPTLAVLSLLGMDPRLAFPIMATAASFALLSASVQCVKLVKLDYRLVMGLAIGAVPAVLIAAFLVKEMPLEILRWLVVAVVTYAGVTLLIGARKPDVVPDEAIEVALTRQ